ncbi:hypothetical protein PV327_001724 [Microctonus hyperodae]|uniref:Uncharacterized protein n=1 Tax=Microctonus hyperodae TaxID=165561 RepID=A0AA39FEG1_MICHY|nr:hypothetical protein PV327_001724 [Microctonus hyperodae]
MLNVCDLGSSDVINDDNQTAMTTLSTFITTVIDDDDNKEELTTIKQSMDEEPQLPVDLLSDDVLLDPNVVLARLSRRDLDSINKRKQQEHFRGYNDWYKSQIANDRREEYNFNRDFNTERRRNNIPKKMKIYPVFPGK